MHLLFMFKVRKNISPSAESALITKTEESNRRDENIIVLAKATSHMMQRGVPTAQIVSTASGSGHWTLSGCVGGKPDWLDFGGRYIRHQRSTSKSIIGSKVNFLRSQEANNLEEILVFPLFIGLLPLRSADDCCFFHETTKVISPHQIINPSSLP